MKKIIFTAIITIFILSTVCAYADDDAGMIIDSATFGKEYKIKGYASVTLLGFKFINMYAQWEDGKASSKITGWLYNYPMVYPNKKFAEHYANCGFQNSGNEADFAWLKADIINLQKNSVNFIQDIKVKIIYDDEYEYDGWVRQFNYDYSKSEIYSNIKEAGVVGWPVCLSPVDEMPIKPMYKGHYAFGCTLPNVVVENKSAPLRMEITMGENKITYSIR